MSIGQVLSSPYTVEKATIIIREMTDSLILNLLEKDLVCDQMVLTVGYDTEGTAGYTGPFENDRYGRRVPKMAHGSINLSAKTSSRREIMTKNIGTLRPDHESVSSGTPHVRGGQPYSAGSRSKR